MHPSHTLPKKLEASAAAGFSAAEIAFAALEACAASEHAGCEEPDDTEHGDLDALLSAAGQIWRLMSDLQLQALISTP